MYISAYSGEMVKKNGENKAWYQKKAIFQKLSASSCFV